jgi:hypothetical protein
MPALPESHLGSRTASGAINAGDPAKNMDTSAIVTVERLLACMGPGERCTRAEIMRRLDAGIASVQHVLGVCVAQGRLRRTAAGKQLVWWKPASAGRPVTAPSFPVLLGYDAELQRLAGLSLAARHPPPPGQTIHYGVGLL